jgi:hypothetical protein
MRYAERLMTPFSCRTISGTSLPSVVVVMPMSAGRAAVGLKGFHSPPLLR